MADAVVSQGDFFGKALADAQVFHMADGQQFKVLRGAHFETINCCVWNGSQQVRLLSFAFPVSPANEAVMSYSHEGNVPGQAPVTPALRLCAGAVQRRQ